MNKDLSEFDVLFDIKHTSGKFRNEEDRLFYLDQKEDRVATIGPLDKADNKILCANEERYKRDQTPKKIEGKGRGKRKMKLDVCTPPMNKRARCTKSYSEVDDSICEESVSSREIFDPDWKEEISIRTKNYRARKDSEKLNISLDKASFMDNIALIADKNILSSRQAVEMAGATLSSSASNGCDLSRLTLSHSSLHRKRDQLRLRNDKIIKEAWQKKSENTLFLLHWDEKSLKHLRQVDGSNAYMAVVLSDLFTGEEKTLSVLEMDTGTAEDGVAAVIESLQRWNISKNQIVGCVFDTTNTNTGWKSGVVVRLEEYLDKRIIHIYCRHHVFERMVNDVVSVCLGSSTAPEELTYKFLINNWKRININNREKLQITRKTRYELQDVIDYATKTLNEVKLKDDYQEVLRLTLVLLDALPENYSFSVRPPGSISHARWMAKILCEFKIVMFSSQLIEMGLITNEDASTHQELALFLIFYYVKPWMTATQSRDAAVNDLELVNSLKKIPPHLLKSHSLFKHMGDAMFSKLEDHLWYLSEELVVLSLFSDKLNDAQKNKCRRAMLKHYTEDLGAVKGKLITPMISNIKSIENLFGKESWRLLRLCGIQGKSFLDKPASTWKDCIEFKKMQNIASNFVVVNDAAERAILLAKMIQNKLTKNSEVKHALVNIVPELRKFSDLKKKNLSRI